MIQNALLTTTDNPYNPFTQWDEWYTFDEAHHYHTCGLLARVTKASETIPDQAIAYGMAEVVRHNVSGRHIMVTEDLFESLIAVPDGVVTST